MLAGMLYLGIGIGSGLPRTHTIDGHHFRWQEGVDCVCRRGKREEIVYVTTEGFLCSRSNYSSNPPLAGCSGFPHAPKYRFSVDKILVRRMVWTDHPLPELSSDSSHYRI